MMRIRTTAAAAALAAAGLFAGAGAAAACDGPSHHGPSHHGYNPAQVLAADCNSHTSQQGDFSSSFTGNVCINF